MIASLIDGRPCTTIDVDDRGLAYGDGVFRTLLMRGGKVPDWRYQYAKLAHDCAALNLACAKDGVWESDLAAIAGQAPDCVIKLIVTRGKMLRGYAVQPLHPPTRMALAFGLPTYPPANRERGVRVRICELKLARQPRLAGIKHLNRLENVLARMEWDDNDISEGLLFDTAEELVGGTMSNVFLLRGAELATPDLAGAGVAGVQRARIIEAAARINADVRIARLFRDDVDSADAILLCNSVFGIWGVRQLDERLFAPHPMISRLRDEFEHAHA